MNNKFIENNDFIFFDKKYIEKKIIKSKFDYSQFEFNEEISKCIEKFDKFMSEKNRVTIHGIAGIPENTIPLTITLLSQGLIGVRFRFVVHRSNNKLIELR